MSLDDELPSYPKYSVNERNSDLVTYFSFFFFFFSIFHVQIVGFHFVAEELVDVKIYIPL